MYLNNQETYRLNICIYLYIVMASKTIMIDLETYNRLKQLKKDISFSQIIRELLDNAESLPLSSLNKLTNEVEGLDNEKIKAKRKDRNVSF
jgi:predicted CopG family antitoxin